MDGRMPSLGSILRVLCLLVVTLGCLSFTENALGDLPPSDGIYDLLTEANVRIVGAEADDNAGYLVSKTGDVNGDGIDDVIVAAPYASPNELELPGAAYVIYGSRTLSPSLIDLASLTPEQGFHIDGPKDNAFIAAAVGSAGDFNKDGLNDVVVGDQGASDFGAFGGGAAYVIYGSPNPRTAVDLATFTAEQGVRIDGDAFLANLGSALGSTGDVNGDSFDDLVIGSRADNNDRDNSGSTYVIYGRSDPPATMNVGDLTPSQGFRVDGAAAFDEAGRFSVNITGDINGDSFDDVVIGAAKADNNERLDSGSAYVIFGNSVSPAGPVDLASLSTSQGFRLDGAADGDDAGISVNSAGDVNGDNLDDVVVGADHADNNGREDSGSAYVVYGASGPPTATIDLASLTQPRGFRVDGVNKAEFFDTDELGSAVSSAGDINGDGLDDLFLGAPGVSHDEDRDGSGSAYVLYGNTAFASSIDLTDLTLSQGFRIDGDIKSGHLGTSVSSAGDVNRDGAVDLIAGAPLADAKGLSSPGSAHIVLNTPRVVSPPGGSSSGGGSGGRLPGSSGGGLVGLSLDGRPSAREGSLIKFRFELSKPASEDISVGFATVPSSGVISSRVSVSRASRRGRDFRARRGTLRIRRGQRFARVRIRTFADDVNERTERVRLRLSSRSSRVRLARRTVTGRILDATPSQVRRQNPRFTG